MAMQTLWHGTTEESRHLLNAFNHNCTCEFGLMGVRRSVCPVHEMFLHDQRALDGLLFMRRQREKLLDQERSASDRIPLDWDQEVPRPAPIKLDCGHYMINGCLTCVLCHRIKIENPLT